MKTFISIGECMLELSAMQKDLWRMSVAGDTLNTAWYARACLSNNWHVSFATKIGNDGMSSKVIDFLNENNIGTDRIYHDSSRTIGLYAIHLNNGERNFTYWRENSAARLLANDQKILKSMLKDSNLVHFSGITLAILPPEGREKLLQILGELRKKGTIISFDPNIRFKLWDSLDLAKYTISKGACLSDIILPSFEEESKCFGDNKPIDTINRYKELGTNIIVVKDAGSSIYGKDKFSQLTCVEIKKKQLVDSTGAGDSFNGVFLASYIAGFDLENSIKKAHNISSHVIEQKGALLPINEVKKIFKSNFYT